MKKPSTASPLTLAHHLVPAGPARQLRGVRAKDFTIAWQRLRLAEQGGRDAAARAHKIMADAKAEHVDALQKMQTACRSAGLPKECQFEFNPSSGRVQLLRPVTKP